MEQNVCSEVKENLCDDHVVKTLKVEKYFFVIIFDFSFEIHNLTSYHQVTLHKILHVYL